MIKSITTHNGKMGFNWSNVEHTYTPVDREQKQYNTSQYPKFLRHAASVHKKANNGDYAAYLIQRSEAFTKSPTMQVNNMQIQQPLIEVDQRKVNGMGGYSALPDHK